MSQEKNEAVDWIAYSDSLDGDTDLMEMLAQLFLEHIGEQIERLQTALTSEDGDAIEKAAHGIKGSLAQVCAETARSSAEQLETRGRDNKLGDAAKKLGEELTHIVGKVRASISAKYG